MGSTFTRRRKWLISRSQTLFFAQGRYRFQYKRPARKTGSGNARLENGLLVRYHVIVMETQIHYTDDGVKIIGMQRYLNRTSRLTIVSREAKKKQAVRDERVCYLQVTPL